MKKWQESNKIEFEYICSSMQKLTDAGIASENIHIVPTPAYRFDKSDQKLVYVILYLSDKVIL